MSTTVPWRKLQERTGQGIQLSEVLPAGLPKPGEDGQQGCEKHDRSGPLLVADHTISKAGKELPGQRVQPVTSYRQPHHQCP